MGANREGHPTVPRQDSDASNPLAVALDIIRAERRRNAAWADDLWRFNLDAQAHVVQAEVEEHEPHENQRWRRYQEWAVAHNPDLPATTRLLFRVILLRMGSQGRPCRAGYSRLAREASMSESHVRAILRREARAGRLMREGSPGERRTSTILDPTPEVVRALHVLWTGARPDLTGIARGSLSRKEEILSRLRDPVFWEDEYWTAYEARDEQALRRFEWARELVSQQVSAKGKGVGLAVELLMDREGLPFKWTTVSELQTLSAFSEMTVRAGIEELEEGHWIQAKRKRGRGGGLLLRLNYPQAIAERVRVKDALYWGDE